MPIYHTLIKFIDHAYEGFRNLYFSKLRSLLALLGILVGTASVVAMIMGGQLATHEALQQFKSLGTDLLAFTLSSNQDSKRDISGKQDQLSLNEAVNLSKVSSHILALAPYTQSFHPIYYQGQPLNGMLLGVTNSFEDIAQVKLKQGRFISNLDKFAFYCVIGRELYDAMKQISHQEPLGAQLQINKNVFIIVGIADEWPENSFVYANINASVMIPLLTSSILSKYATISNVIMRLSPQAEIQNIESQLTQRINQLLPNQTISFRSAKELIAKMQKQNDILTIFLGLIGGISLFVGGIGVMNIMLVSVIERRQEIGIRLAVGAQPKDIALLFLMEAVMLSLTGGLIGVILGVLIAYIIALVFHWQFIWFSWPLFLGFFVSCAVGILSGFYPAYLASKLDPITALKGV